MMRRSGWLFFALAGLGIACSQGPDTLEAPGIAHNAIVNGEASDEQDDAVVKVIVRETEALCSGTLVAPNVVVTALHCVARYDSFGHFICDTKGVLTTSTPPDGEIGPTVAAEGIEVYLGALPGKEPDAYGAKVFGSGSTIICRNDLAFVVLDRELEAPLAALRRQQATVRNEAMRVVGFGQTEMAASTGRYRRDGVLVTAVGAVGSQGASGIAAPNTFVLGPGACQGDSGGPALDEETRAVTGVYSLSAGTSCTSDQIRNVYTNVAAFSVLVDRAFEFAGHTPIAEPGDGGAGETGGAGGAAGETGSSGSTSGGSDGSGGSPSSGGSDVSSGGSETASGGGSAQGGLRTSGGTTGEGSGSRRDSSCAVRSGAGMASGLSGALAALAAIVATAVRRRRRG